MQMLASRSTRSPKRKERLSRALPLDPSPVQTILRRVVLAMLELEKNLVVYRLKNGWKHAEEKANQEIKRMKSALARR